MSQSKREEYNSKYNKYLENKEDYNIYKSRVEKYEDSKKVIKEHFFDRLELLKKNENTKHNDDGSMA